MLGKIEGKRRGAAEDEMTRQLHQLDGPKFKRTRGESGGQRSQARGPHGSQRVGRDLVTEQQQQQSTKYWQCCNVL